MPRACQGYCETHYNKGNLTRENLDGVKRKRNWRFCYNCQKYFNYRILKTYMCICCRAIMKRIQDIGNKYAKKQSRNQKYYQKNKDRLIMNQRRRYQEKRSLLVANNNASTINVLEFL